MSESGKPNEGSEKMSEKKMVLKAGEMVEAVEIDGQDYVEERGELVQFFPVRAKASAMGQEIEFVEGNVYENGLGSYQVKHIRTDGMMMVQYVSSKRSEVYAGQTRAYFLKVQAEAIMAYRKSVQDEAKRSGVRILTGGNDMFLAGWLAANGSFSVLLPEKSMERFEEMYLDVTGEKPDMGRVLVGETPWGIGLRVSFPVPSEDFRSEVKLPAGVDIRVKGGSAEVTKNDFVWGMLKMGMRLGRNEGRVEGIAAKLDGEEKKAFLEGASAREAMLKAA